MLIRLLAHHITVVDQFGPLDPGPEPLPLIENRAGRGLYKVRVLPGVTHPQTRGATITIDGADTVDMLKIGQSGQLYPEIPILEYMKGFIESAMILADQRARKKHGMHGNEIPAPQFFSTERIIEVEALFRIFAILPVNIDPHPRVSGPNGAGCMERFSEMRNMIRKEQIIIIQKNEIVALGLIKADVCRLTPVQVLFRRDHSKGIPTTGRR